jgi:hypothetical protein
MNILVFIFLLALILANVATSRPVKKIKIPKGTKNLGNQFGKEVPTPRAEVTNDPALSTSVNLQNLQRARAKIKIMTLTKEASSRFIGFFFVFSLVHLISIYDTVLLYEGNPIKKLFLKLVTGSIIVINVLAAILEFWRPTQFKKQLKIILFVNIVRETFDFLISMLRAFVLVPEQFSFYLGNALGAFCWMSMFTSLIRSRWVVPKESVRK